MPSAYHVVAAAAATYLLFFIARSIYLLYFHPLSKYPGPKVAAVSYVWRAWSWASGQWPLVVTELHDKYGPVVRVAPEELLFFNVEAYKDIYGHAYQGKKTFVKTDFFNAGEEEGIATVKDPAEHARQRKMLSRGFSQQSLREQEQWVNQYVDTLLEQLGKLGHPSGPGVDLVEAFVWLTFDVISDLAFGKPFNAVASGKTHFWISLIFEAAYASQLASMRRQLPVLNLILPFVLPRGFLAKFRQHNELSREMASNRVKQGDTGRADFFSHLLRHTDEAGISEPELQSQASILIVAGSETTASFLAATSYLLLKNPDTLAHLKDEVRSTFPSLDDISADALAALPYLNGVIEESLRMAPPAAFGLPRFSPGAVVDGHYVPEGVTVSAEPFPIARDPRYWKEPDCFKPERWVGDGFGDVKEASRPFSLGPRACLGINLAYMEMRLVLAKMCWKYDWELVDKDMDWFGRSRLHVFWKRPALNVTFKPRT
ncbi:cytochrome P450 [Colletotrichum navitas]|uniref:Cytochrome P450 n=1 Tax=Colletotrichum navitas TaxID=681940 RepID=A0AAD8V710_9PEZI|nr:cytochrome P450 [Colletotrichum navitas]KAK1595399.1 cytochrome P450 [Colletotrichum navitas]